MHYTVRKTGKHWKLFREGVHIGTYLRKKAAVLTGRILAGRAGTVTVEKA